MRPQRFDDDFFGVIDLVHHQPELPVVRVQYDDIHSRVLAKFGSRATRSQLQLLIEIEQRQKVLRVIDRPGRRGCSRFLAGRAHPRFAPIPQDSSEGWRNDRYPC